MKKYFVIATAVAFMISCAGSPNVETNPVPNSVETPAKAPEQQVAPTPKKEPKVITVRIPVETKASQFFADGSLDEYTLSEYSPADELLATTRFSASGATVERTEFTNKEGKLASKLVKDGEGKVLSRRMYAYNNMGLLITEALEDGAGKSVSSFEYAYDASGHRSSWIVKDSKGVPIAETVYSYKDGKIRSAELRDGSGKKTGSSAYEYGADGRLSIQRFFDASGSTLRIESTQWKDGKILLEERATAGGFVQQRNTFMYGKDGELLKKTMEDIVGKSKQVYEFEYRFREESRTIEA